MNNLERFKKTIRFEDAGRPPLALDGPWADTWERWYSEGYPRGVGRVKDIERIKKMLAQSAINREKLESIIEDIN